MHFSWKMRWYKHCISQINTICTKRHIHIRENRNSVEIVNESHITTATAQIWRQPKLSQRLCEPFAVCVEGFAKSIRGKFPSPFSDIPCLFSVILRSWYMPNGSRAPRSGDDFLCGKASWTRHRTETRVFPTGIRFSDGRVFSPSFWCVYYYCDCEPFSDVPSDAFQTLDESPLHFFPALI